MVSLEALERVLAHRAEELGADFRWGREVIGLVEIADAVSAHTGRDQFDVRWLVGCDGGRSVVRRLAGFKFDGTKQELTGYMAMVEFEDHDTLAPGLNLTSRGIYTRGPAPGRIGVVDFDGGRFDQTSDINLDDLQFMLQHVSGTSVKLKFVQVATSYTDRARQATGYRKGRVLLAGDARTRPLSLWRARHEHRPSRCDESRRKLGATIQGWAPHDLLDTYHSERHPVREWV